MCIKKISIILLSAILLTGFLPLAYAGDVRILSDKEMDRISAGGSAPDIIDAWIKFIFRPVVIPSGDVYNGAIGDSSSNVEQSNISAVVAKHGNINGATIENTNVADISANSATTDQRNIAAVVSLDGNVFNTSINNSNQVTLKNLGNPALPFAEQSNIAVVIAMGGFIDGTAIANMNMADIGISNPGGITTSDFVFDSTLGNIKINYTVSLSPVAAQSNISVIAPLKGASISNTSISDRNIATVHSLLD